MNQHTFQSHGSPAEQVTLSRNLSLFTITMIGVGAMIGAGIFVLTGIAAGVAGPALVLAFALNGLVALLTASAYAELGSAFPEAGGGYLWVKEGLGGGNGFLAGWMSWFAHAVAGSLYALAFGRFTVELMDMAGLPDFGLSIHMRTLLLMTLVIFAFTYINYRGASETGAVGNIITMTKIVILALFILFGILAMLRTEAWHERFTTEFLPNGFLGVLMAMGLTFIAFEGYEIIAQSGEEVINPQRNVPRAIFYSILVAVGIYILVSVTAIGATTPPEGMKVWDYLATKKEIAVVEVAQQTFPWGIGGIVLLISGLVSTMSALNATTYSSSRVSFAMGRVRNLPFFFSKIHPQRHTPHVAVIISGALMLIMAWSLPIEEVAAAADVMFLLLFLQVNVAVMTLRHKMPELERGWLIPWFPLIPILAILANAGLAIFLFFYSPRAWVTAIGWIVVGMLAYYIHFRNVELKEKPKEILLEEVVVVSTEYSVLVPVATVEQAHKLGRIGAMLAAANRGEVLALHVVHVPPQLTLGEGRVLLKEGRQYLDAVIEEAKKFDAPVHTLIRIGRKVHESIRQTVDENASDIIVLGWPGYTNTAGKIFGSVIDPLVDNPPTDVAVVRYQRDTDERPIRAIFVPVAGGPNSRRAVRLAVQLAQASLDGPTHVTLAHVVPPNASEAHRVSAQKIFHYTLEGLDYPHVETKLIAGDKVAETIIENAKGYDLVVIGATEEPLFKNLLVGNIAETIANQAEVTTIMVKRRSSRLHSVLRQTVLMPTTGDEMNMNRGGS
ncbi:MAG TPA: amino acid permease [Anaerolineae bacterium]|nr:amino acid permease [Anaerolineae bacterium]